MSRIFTSLLLGLALAVAGPVAGAPSRPLPAVATTDEARFVTLANEERTKRGLRPLVWDATLCEAARSHSREMARLNYFDHTSPVAGRATPADRWESVIARVPDTYTIGENLFYGSQPDVAWGHRSLMNSPAHRDNLLNPAYQRVGVGVHVAPTGEMWVTEMFLSTGPTRTASSDSNTGRNGG